MYDWWGEPGGPFAWYGQRYGGDPVNMQMNGWFNIDYKRGTFNFSSDFISLNVGSGTLKVEYAKHTLGRLRFVYTDAKGDEQSSSDMTKKQFSRLFGKKYNKADFKK